MHLIYLISGGATNHTCSGNILFSLACRENKQVKRLIRKTCKTLLYFLKGLLVDVGHVYCVKCK